MSSAPRPHPGRAQPPLLHPVPQSTRSISVGLIAAVVALVWAVAATALLVARTVERDRALRQVDTVERKARADVATITAQADTERTKAAKLRREAEEMKLREEEKLHTLYKDLRRYRPGLNSVNVRYVESFTVVDGKVKIKLANQGKTSVYPKVLISFLNRNGFVTCRADAVWNFTSVEPGEVRYDDESLASFSFGDPVYFVVKFLD